MQQKTKIIIIILGAVVVFVLFVATVFDLFPSRSTEQVPQEQEIVIPDRDENLPENTVFDSSNIDYFAELNPGLVSISDQPKLEREAQDLATFFVERFGTYSSDARHSYIQDLFGFMTSSMQVEMQEFMDQSIPRTGFYSVSTDIAGIETTLFSLPTRSAEFKLVVNRVEKSGNSNNNYQQNVSVSLEQNNTGIWFVDRVIWGERI
jgi:hypothetical protein